jgi:hypothetical protein
MGLLLERCTLGPLASNAHSPLSFSTACPLEPDVREVISLMLGRK